MTSGVGEAVEVFATEMEGDTPPHTCTSLEGPPASPEGSTLWFQRLLEDSSEDTSPRLC